MTHTFTTTNSTSHSTPVSGLSDGTTYHYYVRCQDTANNPDLSDYQITFTIANPSSGGTPPAVSNGFPSGTLPTGTTGANLQVTTDVAATCKFGTVPSTVYGSIANTFTTTGGTTHSYALTGLVNGADYNYYVRCSASSDGTVNAADFTVAFSIGSASSKSSSSSHHSHHKSKKKKKTTTITPSTRR